MEHSLNYIYIYDGILPNYIKKSIQNTINIDSDASIIFVIIKSKNKRCDKR